MVQASTYAPFDATYRQWLTNNLGFGSPFAAAYGAQTAPLQQLAYWSDPGSYTGAGTNPYATFLGGQTAGQQPLSSDDWIARAQNVSSALGAGNTGATAAQMRLQERFGSAGDQDPADASRNQMNLANAAIVSQTPMALRGETGRILQRLFDQWQTSDATGNYLDYATSMPQGDLGRFGLL